MAYAGGGAKTTTDRGEDLRGRSRTCAFLKSLEAGTVRHRKKRTMSSLKTALRSEVATQKLQVKENAPVTSMENEARALLSEDAFVSMLYLERRRAERAQKRFVLVLVDVKRALEDGNKNRTLGKIGVALTNSTRETDILGWYLENNLVGIIGTELGETSPAVIHERLLEKLRASFQHNGGQGKELEDFGFVSFFPGRTREKRIEPRSKRGFVSGHLSKRRFQEVGIRHQARHGYFRQCDGVGVCVRRCWRPSLLPSS